MTPRIALVGPGKVGAAIGRCLLQAGYPISAVISRVQKNAEDAVAFIGCPPEAATTDLHRTQQADIILLALPDDQIQNMAERLQKEIGVGAKTTLVHFSGLHPASIMSGAHTDCPVVSIHPLLSFADRKMAASRLASCPCAVEGDQRGIDLGRQLVEAIGGEFFQLPTEAKALYHTAACVASNYLVTITATARDLLLNCGFDEQQALALLHPLQKATLDNLAQLGPEKALTGPVVRGDLGTITQHLGKLNSQPAEQLQLYCQVGQQTVSLSHRSGRLSRDIAEQIRLLLATQLKCPDAD